MELGASPAQPPAPFADGQLHDLSITLDTTALDSLDRNPRQFVPATLKSGPTLWTNIALHLKGNTGSFRPIHDKPSLTLDFARFQPDTRFLGLRRIYLKNSVEDPSYLHELLASEVFRQAGIPAPRVTHARVRINGRRLGLYVLKEGFTQDFLQQHFSQSNGSLYDNDWHQDIDHPLHRNLGPGSAHDQTDRIALDRTTQIPDPTQRWQALDQTLDTDRFLSFMALEVILGHRDGYCLARNNFRIYSDPQSHRLVFLPDGLDQLLGLADFPAHPQMSGRVAAAILDTPQGRLAYTDRISVLLSNVFQSKILSQRIDHIATALRPHLSRTETAAFNRNAADLKRRIAERHAFLSQANPAPIPVRPTFYAGIAHPTPWFPTDTPADGQADQIASPDGTPSLHIRAGRKTSAAWRCRLLLEPGSYRFEARARVTHVTPLPGSRHPGAHLRIAGGPRTATGLTGTTPWLPLSTTFDVPPATAEIQLLCELEAASGDLWIDIASLRLIQLPIAPAPLTSPTATNAMPPHTN